MPLLQVIVYDKDHSPIADATVCLLKDGEGGVDVPYNNMRGLYELSDAPAHDFIISVECPDYELQRRAIEETLDNLGPQTFYLGKQGEMYFSDGQVRIPFVPRPDLIAVLPKPTSAAASLQTLFDELSLVQDAQFINEARRHMPSAEPGMQWSATMLRKADTGDFDQTDSRELCALRSSNLIAAAGPPLGYRHFLLPAAIGRVVAQYNEQALQAAAAYGLSVQSHILSTSEYMFAADMGYGLALLDTIARLKELPEFIDCYPETGALYTIDDE